MRVGVFLPNWVGDVIMATPALRALRKLAGPDGQLVGIMRPYVSEVLGGTSWLDEKIVYAKTQQWLGFPSREIIRNLQAAKLDVVVLLTNSLRTAWMAWRSGARERIGYRNEVRAVLLTKPVRQPMAGPGLPVPTVEGYLHLTGIAGCSPEPATLELATDEIDERAADLVWHQLGLPAGNRVIVLNSGGAFGSAKMWPTEYFSELARRLVRGGRCSVLVNCGPSERETARLIAKQANDPRVVTLAECEELPVGLTKACIRRSRLLVTTDSGPRYIGIAFGRPVVTLFGPTDPRRTKLPYDREICLSLALECQPCMKRDCPLKHHRCMRELTVEKVEGAVAHLLSRVTGEYAA
jgi:heptosyltransferase II